MKSLQNIHQLKALRSCANCTHSKIIETVKGFACITYNIRECNDCEIYSNWASDGLSSEQRWYQE